MSANATDPSISPRNRMTIVNRNVSSPRTGAASAPVNHDSRSYLSPGSHLPSPRHQSMQLPSPSQQRSLLTGQPAARGRMPSLPLRDPRFRRGRAGSMENEDSTHTGTASSLKIRTGYTLSPRSPSGRRVMSVASASIAKAKARTAQKENDSMVYLDGPVVYTCAQCRTHLTSHDDIISKSFHGRHGRAYLFDQCVNVTIGKAEDRLLITGLHSVCDIYCKRCKNMVGWTYAKAYEASQKYKEGKFIIEKINLHLEESPSYDVVAPAGERSDRWRRRSMSWGNEFAQSPPMSPRGNGEGSDLVYEYRPSILPQSGFNRCQSM